MVPDSIDVRFLDNFRKVVQKYLNFKKFFIITGGGKTARNYQKALLKFGAKQADRDWIGISASKLNAQVVKHVFYGYSYPEIVTDPNKKLNPPAGGSKKIIVGAGWKPGWSTDYCAVLIAKTNGIKTIVNLTNIDYVYDKNPNDFPDAKPLKQVDWKSFSRIVGDEWIPGLSMPFDPRAAKLAARLKLKVAVINGKKLEQFENFLNEKPFIGTIIQ